MNKTKGKKTLVLGASENEARYSNMAVKMLNAYHHPVVAVGKKSGMVDGIPIETNSNCDKNSQIDTITLYLNPENQQKYIQQILEINPNRVIFNPGTENEILSTELDKAGIAWEEACTLVLLRSGQF